MNNFTARNVWFDDIRVYVQLNDGRVVGSPLAWFPRLQHATPEQRNRFELVAEGFLTYSRK